MMTIYRSEEGRRAVEERYRAFRRRWPAPATESVIPTRHGDTFVIAAGPPEAPAVVLLHGAGFNSTAWLGDVAAWARTHRVYAVDVIGEPGLSAPSRPSLASDAYADWLDDVLDGLGAARAAFVGTSLGGWIALDYAVRRPDRVTRLALLVPGGIGRQRYGAIIASLFLLPFGAWGQRVGVGLVIGPVATPEVTELTAADRQDFADYLLLIHRSYRLRRDRLPTFTDDQLRRLPTPLLYIAGAKDRMLDSHHAARRLRRLLPGAVVTLLPGIGHIPVGYSDSVARFLAGGGER
nr:alpha/beta fold hydrolase [Micromonospora sp. DSM 115978]